MKIKTDFVTNSSSTAFVVIIPNKFYTNEEEIKELYNGYDMYDSYEEAKADEAFDELEDCIEDLKSGKNVWYYLSDGLNQTIYNSILDICSKHNFIITSFGMNGEGNNIIQGIKEEQIETILINNMNILSIFKMIQRDTNNDTSKNK